MDHASGWTQQFHYGPLRNVNTRLWQQLGPDIGCDSIGNPGDARSLARFLDRLDRGGTLAQTIVYNIHPSDNEMVASMLGNFQSGPRPGKLQLGSGWWFNDQLDGMRRQLETLSQLGLLSRFVGMLTDSRSFLSFTRHEYFRRLLCQLLGQDMEKGLGNFEDDSFDTVILAQTLQALHQPREIVREMLRVGKYCILTFPNFAYWRHRFFLLGKGRAFGQGIRHHGQAFGRRIAQLNDTFGIHPVTLSANIDQRGFLGRALGRVGNARA
jgi:hypothetical protein